MYECPYCQKTLEDVDLEVQSILCPHCKNEISFMDCEEDLHFGNTKASDTQKSDESPPRSDFDLASEIESFGNSSEANTFEGPLKFSLILSKVDTPAMKKEVFFCSK